MERTTSPLLSSRGLRGGLLRSFSLALAAFSYSMAVIVPMFFLGSTSSANALRLATAMRNLVSRICFFCLPTCAAMRSSSSPTSEKVSCRPASHRNLPSTITDTLDRSLRL